MCEMGGVVAKRERKAENEFYDKLFATNFVYLMVCFHPRMFKHFGKLGLASLDTWLCSKFNW